MLRNYREESLVLKRVKKGEADSFFTLLTRQRGLITVIAKGIRKINSRRAPYLEIFNHLVIFLAKGKNIDVVTDITPIENFKNLKSDLAKVAVAFKITEITERILPEREPHTDVFDMLLATFQRLNFNSQVDRNLGDAYNLYLLKNLGYIPSDRIMSSRELDSVAEEIMEKKIKTNILLSKLV